MCFIRKQNIINENISIQNVLIYLKIWKIIKAKRISEQLLFVKG